MSSQAPVRATARELLRPALLLGGAGALTIPLLFPYLMVAMPQLDAKLTAAHVPLALAMAGQTVQGFVIMTLLAWSGFMLARRLPLDAPWVRAWTRSGVREAAQPAWLLAGVLGFVAGAALVLIDMGFQPLLPPTLQPIPAHIERWRGLLASFYGGISEEIIVRLFLMTLVAWGFARLLGAQAWATYWLAIPLSALAFGAGHLPAAAQVWHLTPIVVARVMVLNSIAGIVFGWLYWKRGLEHAMAAHFCADIVLHVVA